MYPVASYFPPLAVLFFLFPSVSQSAPDIDMGGLSPYLSDGPQGYWNVIGENGSVVLENSEGSGDITYYYLNPGSGEEGRREISVDVQLLNTSPYSWAGMLYGYTDNPRSYYIYTVGADNNVSLYHRTNTGFELRFSQSSPGRADQINQLGIRESGNMIELKFNGHIISSFGNDSIGFGAVGIAAGDIGTYRFQGFDVNVKKPASDASIRTDKPAVRKAKPGKSSSASTFRYVDEYDPVLGMVSARTPIPAHWKKLKKPESAENGLKIIYKGSNGEIIYENTARMAYISSGDPQLDGIAQQRGAIVEPYQPIDQLMTRLLADVAKGNGAKMVASYKLPELLDFHRQDVLNDPWNIQHFDTFVTEWDLVNGNKALNMAVQVISEPTQRALNNSYNGRALAPHMIMVRGLEAPQSVFEDAKHDFIASVVNTEINAVWKEISQRNHVEKMARIEAKGKADVAESWRRHNSKMASMNANSNAQENIGKTYSDILDINHSGYTTRSNIQYAGQKSNIRGIHERTKIYGSNGTSYAVPAGSKHYWVNQATGYYLGTDNPNFDPRVNKELSGQWEMYNQQ